MELCHENIKEHCKFSYDFGKSRIVDGLGNEVQQNEISDLLARVDPEFAQGVGTATAARAIATRAAFRGYGDTGLGGGRSLQQSGAAFGDRGLRQ